MISSKVLSYEEFIKYFEKHKRFPDGSYVKKSIKYTIKEIESRYNKYVRRMERLTDKIKEDVIDEKWERVKAIVDARDDHSCRLFRILDEDEIRMVLSQLRGRGKIVDRAHVFRRSSYPSMKYMSENVYCLCRLFHERLDSFQDPITGAPISKEESDSWWKRIIGEDKYNRLLDISKGGKNERRQEGEE